MALKERVVLGVVMAICMIVCIRPVLAQAQKQDVNIVFIGNSITYGANLENPKTDAPPLVACAYLSRQPNIGKLAFSNQGHSGFTTVDFLPATGTAFKQVETAVRNFADQKALLIFSIKLGTNDSAIQGPNGSPVSKQNYKQNLKVIADSLLKEFPGCVIIFQHPIWYSPNTYNGAKYLQEGLTRLQSYIPEIDALVDEYSATYPKQVFVGDKKAFKYFEKNFLTDLTPENGHMGTFYLHPNKKGAAALGTFDRRDKVGMTGDTKDLQNSKTAQPPTRPLKTNNTRVKLRKSPQGNRF
jgi:lysophospholipase L1-like esterase